MSAELLLFMINWGVQWKVLSSKVSPSHHRVEEEVEVGTLKGADMGVVSTLREFLSPEWSPPVLSLDRGGRCIVQRRDMTFAQCFCQIGCGGGN